ncbi:MAG: hypothetical protein HKN32_05925 [Flavobacteriales bacterium]|nr:hypothetical protein [Flavobacteriales bacterium]
MEYHLMADGLVWSDEYVLLGEEQLELDFNPFFSTVVNIRTSKILGTSIEKTAEDLLSQVVSKCPDWVFCDLSRYSIKHAERFEHLRLVSHQKIRDFFTRGDGSLMGG